jgi:hypothetical protein
MGSRVIHEDLYVSQSIVDHKLPEGQKIHKFLADRAQALAGKYIDFKKTPVTFVLSDKDEPNAFFMRAPHNPDGSPSYEDGDLSDGTDTRLIEHPINTAIICVTRGLIEMVDNLDQLDFVLGHELTHMIMRQNEVKRNSKGEEEMADLHAVDLMYDAGSDPKQALTALHKINAYAEEAKRKHPHWQRIQGLNWSEILDVHMTDRNRRAGIEASLTRLSHLIDDRQPTSIDKDIFAASYTDPVDEFLKTHNYENQKSLGKLKILIDCVDHLSETPSSNKKSRPAGKSSPEIAWDGTSVEKKYQQKIATLAEAVLDSVEKARRTKGGPNKPANINGADLKTYLQDKAYTHITKHGYPHVAHITKHGYPHVEDENWRSGTAILYTYFYQLLGTQSYTVRKTYEAQTPSKLEQDISATEQKIKQVQSADELTQALDRLETLYEISSHIRKVEHRESLRVVDKLDNLSTFKGYYNRELDTSYSFYEAPKGDEDVPWNNLIGIAKTDEQIKARIITLLDKHNIIDYRVTHGLPYIQYTIKDCYRVTEDGKTEPEALKQYELDFALNSKDVSSAYEYIEKYFRNETETVKKHRKAAENIVDHDFVKDETLTDSFNRHTEGDRKIYDLIAFFNALPDANYTPENSWSKRIAPDFIPLTHLKKHPVPGTTPEKTPSYDRPRFEFSHDLLTFDNPIFVERFGKDYEDKLVAQKNAHREAIFGSILVALDQLTIIWEKADREHTIIRDRENELLKQIRALGDKGEYQQIKALRQERMQLYQEREFLYEKKEQASTIIHNILFSVLKDRAEYWDELHNLNEDERNTIAQIVVRDEHNTLRDLIKTRGYELFCDYVGVIEEQTKRALSGDFTYTPIMQAVATNYGYTQGRTKVEIESFEIDTKTSRSANDFEKYIYYLHAFDIFQYLQNNSQININHLAVTFSNIEQPIVSLSGFETKKMIRERRDNYRKFITNTDVIKVVTKAINNEENYQSLSNDGLLSTADNLAQLRKNMKEVYSELNEQPGKFIDTLNNRIENIFAQAEERALQKENALEKVMDLYHIYNPPSRAWSKHVRVHHIDKGQYAHGRWDRLSAIAEDSSFWPEDPLDHIKAFIFAQQTFLDDKELENKFLTDILDKVESLPASRQKLDCLHILLDKDVRASDPDIRQRLFDIYADHIFAKIGLDDGSTTYSHRLAAYFKAFEVGPENKESVIKDWDIGEEQNNKTLLSYTISSADKYQLLRTVSDKIISQENCSQMIKDSCQIKLNSDDMLDSYLYGIGVDFITEDMDQDPDTAHKLMRFFNSKGEKKDCNDISLHASQKAESQTWADKKKQKQILRQAQPANCKALYDNFWAAPLEARAVIIARMLKSAAQAEDADQHHEQDSWERVFGLVMNNLIKDDDQSTEARYARDIMHSYIKSRSDYERVLILSAMMVANRNIGNDTGNIGKALKLFLENMGPAEIKLGQAIASHPNTPQSIRQELQHLKNAADMPARWTLYDCIKAENIPEKFWKDKYLGQILGSASYYTTVELGEDKVLRILRPEAREKAAKGFRVIGDTVDDLKQKDTQSDLDYQELTSAVQEMVAQAAKMAHIETDHEIGQQQYEDAADIYDDVTLTSDETEFTLKAMDWDAKGQNWIHMDRAKGPTFNALPEKTPEQIQYKKNFAKAYIVFELQNILSGHKFDHDKHGAQLSIDPATNVVGIYDTGAMALNDPSATDQKRLGHIIYRAVKDAMNGRDAFTAFSDVIRDKIEELHQSGEDTQYLVEVKKGLLALGDFFHVLDKEDVQQLLTNANLLTTVSADVQSGITEKMSFLEQAQFKGFMALQTKGQKGAITIQKQQKGQNRKAKQVETFAQGTSGKDKSTWLKNMFKKPGSKKTALTGASPQHMAGCMESKKPS